MPPAGAIIPWYECVGTRAQLLTFSWAAFKSRAVCGFQVKGSPTVEGREDWKGLRYWWKTLGRPSKPAYLLWQMSQVSWRTAGRKKCSQCFIEKKPDGVRTKLFGPVLLFLSALWERDILSNQVDGKRKHSLKLSTLPCLSLFIYILVDCASVLSADQNLFFA